MAENSLEEKRKAADALLLEWEKLALQRDELSQEQVLCEGKPVYKIMDEITELEKKRCKEDYSREDNTRLHALSSIPQIISYSIIKLRAGLVSEKYMNAMRDVGQTEATWSDQTPQTAEEEAVVSENARPTTAGPSAGAQLTNNRTCSHAFNSSREAVLFSRKRVPRKSHD